MKKIVVKNIIAVAILIVFFTTAFSALAYVSVRGDTRSDGTYVAPHVRSNPNGLKYDNYGYKPSQGLYNKTYGTRGSDWDTPTWTTDPDYYEGKSLYEQGYTVDKRPKGMSRRQFEAATSSSQKSISKTAPTVGNIQKEINTVKWKYGSNPSGFRERLIDQICNYLGADKSQVANEVYRSLPDVK